MSTATATFRITGVDNPFGGIAVGGMIVPGAPATIAASSFCSVQGLAEAKAGGQEFQGETTFAATNRTDYPYEYVVYNATAATAAGLVSAMASPTNRLRARGEYTEMGGPFFVGDQWRPHPYVMMSTTTYAASVGTDNLINARYIDSSGGTGTGAVPALAPGGPGQCSVGVLCLDASGNAVTSGATVNFQVYDSTNRTGNLFLGQWATATANASGVASFTIAVGPEYLLRFDNGRPGTIKASASGSMWANIDLHGRVII